MPMALMMGSVVTLSAGGGVTPITILGASLLAWWTADRSDLITLSGSAVTSWKDVVAGYDATQGVSASRPVYSATSFNGAPGLTFDAVDDQLTCTNAAMLAALPDGAEPGEIWAIAQQDALGSDTTLRRVASYGGASAVARYLVHAGDGATTNLIQAYAGNGAAPTGSLKSGFSGRRLGRGIYTAADVSVSLDGVAGTTSAVGPATVNTRLRIGSHSDTAASGFWNGKVRDLVLTGPLSPAQIAALEAWALPRRML